MIENLVDSQIKLKQKLEANQEKLGKITFQKINTKIEMMTKSEGSSPNRPIKKII